MITLWPYSTSQSELVEPPSGIDDGCLCVMPEEE
jgi:hypothetical protein